ncbi:class I SAM-dependent methyltransferase [Kitasatospora sp. NPDC089797]|uniref:class I SAM-dependent methyltransferase n=1 Tax=Kitasatospora sp. NPDC089797 TaxID=3155298 RepID=UPI003440A68C
MGDDQDIGYAVTAEFYDLLQAETDRRQARRRFAEPAARARQAILDVGAGTGIVTGILLTASAVPVHAVEPSAPMRAALLTRLAALGADQRARVTLHPEPIEETGLVRAVDLAIASNVVATLPPPVRRATWQAVARALTPGGVLLFDPPPETLPGGRETAARLGPVRVGPDLYSAELTLEPERGILRSVFTYRVERDGVLQREEREAFDLWPVEPALLRAELEAAGLHVVQAPHADLVAARRTAS